MNIGTKDMKEKEKVLPILRLMQHWMRKYE